MDGCRSGRGIDTLRAGNTVTGSSEWIIGQHDRFFHSVRSELGDLGHDDDHHSGHGPCHHPFDVFGAVVGRRRHPTGQCERDPTSQCDRADTFSHRRWPDHTTAWLDPTVAQRHGGGRTDRCCDSADR